MLLRSIAEEFASRQPFRGLTIGTGIQLWGQGAWSEHARVLLAADQPVLKSTGLGDDKSTVSHSVGTLSPRSPPDSWHFIAWALLATVLLFTTASVVSVILNDRAGQRASAASQVAEAYSQLEGALLREEVERHDLLMEGGSNSGLLSAQRAVAHTWTKVQSSGDDDHLAEARELGKRLNLYQAAVSKLLRDHPAGVGPPAADQSTDVAAALLITQAARETAEHGAESAKALGEMETRQKLAARYLPVLGALSLLMVAACMRLLTAQRRRMVSLREEAHTRSVTDELTGLPNRAGLRISLQRAVRLASRDRPVALLLLDLNGFKAVNDTFGHELGDEVLKVVAARLLEAAPVSSVVARLGGDEFVVMLPDASQGVAEGVAQTVFAALSVPTVVRSVVSEVGASIGLSLTDGITGTEALTASDLLRRADIAMYAAKNAGSGPVFFAASLAQPVADGQQGPEGPRQKTLATALLP